ncbi:DUF6313 family protein [Actinoplanes sp. NPDC051851]|uniref:DUF6313 family protein n=1 Tax=Actinoplanes sp. NPDC051851 TaxID=3154753 RepID=UPI00343AA611
MTPADRAQPPESPVPPSRKQRTPKRSFRDKIKFARWSLDGLPNISHFITLWVSPILISYLALFTANGILNGWLNAYKINLAINAPWDEKDHLNHPWLAVPLSIAGWLVIPVMAGAVVGYLVNFTLQRRRAPQGVYLRKPRSIKRATKAGGNRNAHRDPRLLVIPSLRDRSETDYFGIGNGFVEYFVALHDDDWSMAEDHFAREVSYVLKETDAVKPDDRQSDAVRLAVSSAVEVLMITQERKSTEKSESPSTGNLKPPRGTCPYCGESDESKVGGG